MAGADKLKVITVGAIHAGTKNTAATIKAEGEATRGIINTLIGDAWKSFLAFTQGVVENIRDLLTKIPELFKSFSDAVVKAYADVVDALGKIPTWLTDHLVKPLGVLLTNLWELFKEFVRAILTEGLKEGKAILGVIWPALKAAGSEIASLLSPVIDPLMRDIKGAIEQNVLSGGKGHPSRALTVAAGVFAAGSLFGTTASGLAALGDSFHPLKETGMKYFAALAADLGDFSGIAHATTGTVLRSGVARPMEYYVNSVLTPIVPGPRDLAEMVTERLIDDGTYQSMMRYHGLDETWSGLIKEVTYKKAKLRDLAQILPDMNVPLDFVTRMLTKAHYDPELIEGILPFFAWGAQKGGRQQLVGAAVSAYKNGVIDEAGLGAELDRVSMRPEEKLLYERAATLGRLQDEADSLKGYYLGAFSDGVISDGELRAALMASGYDARRARLLADAAAAKRKAKVLREEKAAAAPLLHELHANYIALYREQFRDGLIDAVKLKENLLAAGLDEHLAGIMVAQEEVKAQDKKRLDEFRTAAVLSEKVTRAYQAAYVEQFRKDLIDDKHLAELLATAGVPADIARAVVDTEVARKIKPPSKEELATTQATGLV